MDGLLAGNAEALEALPIEKRAMIPGGLSDDLSIKDIATLAFLDDKEKQEALIKALVASCSTDNLVYYGDINGWSYREDMPNPYPKVKGIWYISYGDGRDILFASPHDCLIHRDDFKAYLQKKGQWPVKGLLANWWAGYPQEQKGLMITPPEVRKSREELDELRRLREERQLERDTKRWEQTCEQMHEHNQLMTRRIQHNRDIQKDIQKQAYIEALRELEAENQAKAAQTQAEGLGNDGANNQDDNTKLVIKQINSNEFAFSGLLHQPTGDDDWFEVIDIMTKAFYCEHSIMPTKAQAWAQLCTNPPDGYNIKPTPDNLSLTMPGVIKPFTKRSFGRRWAKYTAESNPYKPN